jgi:hypothetical protein
VAVGDNAVALGGVTEYGGVVTRDDVVDVGVGAIGRGAIGRGPDGPKVTGVGFCGAKYFQIKIKLVTSSNRKQ